ncbi:MAG: uridylate kinase [Methanolinea sp.]|nr:uridylate kinase [Methanolinea sp.]
MTNPVVVKMGGSLFEEAPRIVDLLRSLDAPVLVVPGGGRFAQAVRDCGVDGTPAHWMAIAAMEEYGWYISSFGLPVTEVLSIPDSPGAFLPYRELRSCDPLPHSWKVTSDTIAAWVAHTLGLDLILLKSVDGIRSQGVFQEVVDSPLNTGDVDPCLIPYTLSHGVRTRIVNGRVPGRIVDALTGKGVHGTTIGF